MKSTASSRTVTHIAGGLERYTVDAGPLEQDLTEECSCARCGSSVEFKDCWNCHGERWVEVAPDDIYEEIGIVPCDVCEGMGGRGHCISTPEYCEAHPMPGRESIKSTAMNSEAWNE